MFGFLSNLNLFLVKNFKLGLNKLRSCVGLVELGLLGCTF
jgi:hypothetical protein